MRPTFDEIYEAALDRKGRAELHDRLPSSKESDELEETPDDRYLAAMARAAFSAGFKWYIVDNMWDGFEEAFRGFDPEAVAAFDDRKIAELGEDERIVRNKTKIWATVENARMVRSTSREYGGFGAFVADWELDETVQLWEYLGEHGTHLGGNTGPRALRHAGRDTFILTRDVTYALEQIGVMTYGRRSKSGRRQAQEAFLAWRKESERSLSAISMILACSMETPDHF